MQSILVSGATNRIVRSVSGCLVRSCLGSKPRWCNFVVEAAKRTTPDSGSFRRDDLGYFSWAGTGPDPDPWSEEAEEARIRNVREHVKYLRTIKSEEQTRMAFDRWAAEHERVYDSEEEKEFRFGIFVENLKMINEHNLGKSSINTMGLSCFSDMTMSEVPCGLLDFEDEFDEVVVGLGA